MTPAGFVRLLLLAALSAALSYGVAYLIYFRLITDFGAASALTVTLLIPVFAALWGGLDTE
jgi:drug/metabolite transporter (DMT)-like permease